MAVTTISRTAYNALVDDSGTGSNGTVWQKSNVKDILDALDAILAGNITTGGSLRIGWNGDATTYTQANELTVAGFNTEALGLVGTTLTNLNMYLAGTAARVATIQSSLGGTQGGQLILFAKPDSASDVVEVARLDHNKTFSVQGGVKIAANATTNPGAGGFYKSSSAGFVLNTSTGSVFDFQLVTPSLAATIMSVATGTPNVTFYGNIDATNSYKGRAGSGGTVGNAFNIFWTGAAAQLWIDSTNVGNISIVSDARVKTNVRPLTKGLDAVLQLLPRVFEWATGSPHDAPGPQFGLIAQEAEAIVPELVSEMPPLANAGTDGTPADGLKRVDYLGLVPVLILAAQELHARVAALEGRR